MAAHQAPPSRDSPGKNTGVGCHFLLQCMKVKSEREVAQSCSTLRDPMDCSPPGSSVHGIFQARVLEWGAIAVAKSYPTLYDPLDCSLLGFSVHGISQARILEWVAVSSSRESSQLRDWTCVSCIAGWFFTTEPPGKPSGMLLLLLSRFSRVRLCATPQMAAHQAPPSLGFSRQEHWSGLPFPSPMHESESEVVQSCWTQQPHGLQPTRLLHPWDFQARVLEWVAIAFSEVVWLCHNLFTQLLLYLPSYYYYLFSQQLKKYWYVKAFDTKIIVIILQSFCQDSCLIGSIIWIGSWSWHLGERELCFLWQDWPYDFWSAGLSQVRLTSGFSLGGLNPWLSPLS